MHVHVLTSSGEAKFWIEPHIELAVNHGLNTRQINAAEKLVKEHFDEIQAAWKEHFES